jgi:hypothetical protein
MFDYYLGGAHNFAADRETANAVLAVAPEVRATARANRAFLRRAIGHALAAGIRQFLDLGSGTPTIGNVHEIARAVDPTARVVYVDNDAVVVAHTNAVLDDVDMATAFRADIRDPATILDHEETHRLIDFTQPVAVLMVSVLHFIPGDLTDLVAALRQPMARGSQLVISHASLIAETRQTKGVQHLYARTPTPLHLRSPDEIRALLGNLELVHPNSGNGEPADLVPVIRWRPEPGDAELASDLLESPFVTGLLAGVGVSQPTAAAQHITARNQHSRFDRTFLRTLATTATA